MVNLYTVLKLIGDFKRDNDLVYLRNLKENEPGNRPEKIMTVREVKEKFDLRKTTVTAIRPYFCCNDYQGLLLTITEQRGEKMVEK